MKNDLLWGGALRRAALSVAAPFALIGGAFAQEGGLGPAPPLEFPFQAAPEAPRGVSMQFFRAAIEKGADLGLCKALMTKDGKQMPRDAQGVEFCPNDYAGMVANNEGFIQWAPNARPLKCNGCVGRPFMSAEDNLTAPNLRRTMAFGRLEFLSTTGPNRTITYSFDSYFLCKAKNGAKEGDLTIDIKFGPPVIGEPGFWESVASFSPRAPFPISSAGKLGRTLKLFQILALVRGAADPLALNLDRRPYSTWSGSTPSHPQAVSQAGL